MSRSRPLISRASSLRRQVLGDAFVDANLAESDDFMMTFQELVTRTGMGTRVGVGSHSTRRRRAS